MKKLRYYLIFAIIILFPLTFTKALTKVEFKEVSNGVIDTTIHFDEGFVGGLDLVLGLSDNIDVKNFIFNNNFKNFTTNTNVNNHTLTIKVTAGGIGTEHNLLNSNKELYLGRINLVTSLRQSTKYTFNVQSIKIIGNNWETIDIDLDTITTINDTFTYVIGADTSNNDEQKNDKPVDNNQNSQNNNTDNDNHDTNNNTSTNNTTKPNNSNNNVSNNNDNQSNNVDNNTNNEEVDTNTENNNDNSNDTNKEEHNQSNDIKEEKEQNKSSIVIKIVLIIVVMCAIGILIYMIYKIIKNKKKITF